jgi:rhodanese-related sulfurtransferase
VADLWVQLRQVAEEHVLELRLALNQMVTHPQQLSPMTRETLLAQARRGEVVVIDVRPRQEYDEAHLPFARSMPVAELKRRINELPKGKEIVAYCRGPFCLLSDEAMQILIAQGRRVRKLTDGVNEWRAAGLPLETSNTP